MFTHMSTSSSNYMHVWHSVIFGCIGNYRPQKYFQVAVSKCLAKIKFRIEIDKTTLLVCELLSLLFQKNIVFIITNCRIIETASVLKSPKISPNLCQKFI